MLKRSMLIMLFVFYGQAANADEAPVRDATRGELLYVKDCISCHSSQVHWRDKKLATDWQGLQAEVRRWQAVSGLAWSDGDIVEVTRYLNSLYYHYPKPD